MINKIRQISAEMKHDIKWLRNVFFALLNQHENKKKLFRFNLPIHIAIVDEFHKKSKTYGPEPLRILYFGVLIDAHK